MVVDWGGYFGSIGWGVSYRGSSNFGNDWGGLHVASVLVHDGVETVVWVSGVLNGSGGTIRLNQGVRSLYDISLTGLVLALVVSGQGVLDVIGVAVDKNTHTCQMIKRGRILL